MGEIADEIIDRLIDSGWYSYRPRRAAKNKPKTIKESRMATEYITGPCMYAKVFESNRDLKGYEDQYVPHGGMYLISVGVPEGGPDFRKIMKWNRMYSPKIGGEDKGFELDRGAVAGMAYFTFKRKHAPLNGKGEVIDRWGGQPEIWKMEGDARKRWDNDVMIGNGSTVTVKLDVSPSPKNDKITFVRLEALMVDKFVPYEKREAPGAGSKEYPDDEIPF